MEHTLYCGAASGDITPKAEEVSGLFALMGISYAGIIDSLALRVIALKSDGEMSLIVAFDLDKAPQPKLWLPKLSERTGIPEERILYFSTHTHTAPLTTIRPREKNRANMQQRENMNRYEAFVLETLLACVDRAIADLRPARMGFATGKSYVNVNRNADFVYTDEAGKRFPFICEAMNWGAPVDRTVAALRFEDLEGRPIAFFVNYALHCCLMFQNNFDGKGGMGISGDVAGRISTWLEEAYPGTVAIWSSGAAGDVDPVLFNAVLYPDHRDGSYVKEGFESWKTTQKLLNMIASWHYKDVRETLEKITCDRQEVPVQGVVEWSETPSVEEAPYRIRLQALQLGDVALVGVGGELYSSLGKVLREASPVGNTVVINHNASLIDDAGYILDDDTIYRAAQDAPVPHFIPGGKTRSVPGVVADSLRSHIRHMLKGDRQ